LFVDSDDQFMNDVPVGERQVSFGSFDPGVNHTTGKQSFVHSTDTAYDVPDVLGRSLDHDFVADGGHGSLSSRRNVINPDNAESCRSHS
jgi:hypothetical protein